MAMIFPGMDPYLENPRFWPSLHSRLVVYIADHLQTKLGPRYVTGVEERVYVEGPDRTIVPDVWLMKSPAPTRSGTTAVAELEEPLVLEVFAPEIHESYIEILDLSSNERIVTVIEVVSPANKFAGAGRESYLAKQREVLDSQAHLVEIDLLRDGPHVVSVPREYVKSRAIYDYLVCISRARRPRTKYETYPRRLPERLPRFGIPLADDDPDVPLDLQAIVVQAYDAGGYRSRIDYSQPCQPPLSAENQAWADEQIKTDS